MEEGHKGVTKSILAKRKEMLEGLRPEIPLVNRFLVKPQEDSTIMYLMDAREDSRETKEVQSLRRREGALI